MKKILFVATVVKTHISQFHIPYLKWFKENGFETHVCAKNDYENKVDCIIPFCDKYFDVPFERSPFKRQNIKAYNQLKEIIASNEYDIIHCHTPMGGVLTRLAALSTRKKGTKVIYTAHGFHFYEGAPIKNWLLYYPIEKLLSKYTDCLITINEEDYETAVHRGFKAESIKLINGVGIDMEKFKPQNNEVKLQLRNIYGYNEDDFILIFAGELSYGKHQDLLINAVSLLKDNIPNIKLILAGTGKLLEKYKNQVRNLHIEDNVNFLGYRKDIDKLMILSDLGVSSSRREGLPVNVMECMASGLPLIATNCRGNRDLVKNKINGFIVEIDDAESLSESIKILYNSKKMREKFSQNNLELIRNYSLDKVMKDMTDIYLSLIN